MRNLLLVIAIDHNLVTYTSCEGHDYRASRRVPDERHVGVIPRDLEEQHRAIVTFEIVGADVNSALAESAVEVALMVHSVSDGDQVYPALDLYLSKKVLAQWDDYFAQLDAASECLVKRLQEGESIA